MEVMHTTVNSTKTKHTINTNTPMVGQYTMEMQPTVHSLVM